MTAPNENTLVVQNPSDLPALQPAMQPAMQPAIPLLPSAHEYKVYLELADQFVKTGFLPSAIKNAAQALAVMLTGRELGLPPMLSLRMIHVIDGKPGMSSELQLARFRRAGGKFEWVHTDAESAEIAVCAPGGSKWTVFTFTIEEAKKAEVTGKANWKKYPAAMLRARVAMLAIRAVAPDISAGFYDPDELGAETNDSGEVEAWPEPAGKTAPPAAPGRRDRDRDAPAETAADSGDDDPVLPVKPFMDQGVRLSDPAIHIGVVLGFVWKCIDKKLVKHYSALIQKAMAVFPLKLQDATLDQLGKTAKWIIDDANRVNTFKDELASIEHRMETIREWEENRAADAGADTTEPDSKPEPASVPVEPASQSDLDALIEAEIDLNFSQ